MTVAELIEELRKFPAHHTVIARWPESFNYDHGGVEYALGSVETLESSQSFTTREPIVIVEVAQGIR